MLWRLKYLLACIIALVPLGCAQPEIHSTTQLQAAAASRTLVKATASPAKAAQTTKVTQTTKAAQTTKVKELVPVVASAVAVNYTLTPAEKKMTDKARPYMPGLKANVDKYWPTMPYPSTFGALIEKESLWNPRAELCVPKPSCSREYGFGFGQLTITKRFNVFEEAKTLSPDLKAWTYADRFNPNYQLAAVVLKNRLHYRQCEKIMKPGLDVHACGFSSYNGGYGGVLADQRICSNTRGCNPKVWFGNVELQSVKAKKPLAGYGQSFYQINRGYVRALLIERPGKYTIFPGFEALPPKP